MHHIHLGLDLVHVLSENVRAYIPEGGTKCLQLLSLVPYRWTCRCARMEVVMFSRSDGKTVGFNLVQISQTWHNFPRADFVTSSI